VFIIKFKYKLKKIGSSQNKKNKKKKKKRKMASSKNKNNRNSDVKESNNNFKIELFIKDLDNGDLAIFKTSINNINKDNSEKIDIPLEIYKNGFLNS